MPAPLNFKEIAESVDVETVAHYLGLRLKRSSSELRGACPACNRGGDRAIEILPETNTFICYVGEPRPGNKHLSGDVIGLYAHIKGYQGMYRAAKEVSELFATPTGGRTAPPTPPQKPEARTAQAQPAPPKPAKPANASAGSGTKPANLFDPASFAKKLVWSPEVEALGITEADAERLGIGWHERYKRIYFAIRDEVGLVVGYIGYGDGQLKVPESFLPSRANVIPLRRA